MALADRTAAFFSAAVNGIATLSPAMSRCWLSKSGQHLTLSPKFVPRGSKPTMSNRSSRSLPRKNGAAAAIATPEPPGPPGLRNRLPIRFDGWAARIRRTATSVFAPLGRS